MAMRATRQRGGFTLIELLAGMTILIMIVLFLTQMFTRATSIMTRSTKQVESNLEGRAVVEFIARELASAIVDDTLTLKLESDEDQAAGGVRSDRIYFVASAQKSEIRSDRYRQSMQVSYRITNMRDTEGRDLDGQYRILRLAVENEDSTLYRCYETPTWWQSQKNNENQTVANHVRTMEFWVYDASGTARSDYDSTVHGPPAYIDVCVELLGENDAEILGQMSSGATEFADRVSHRYFTRVYLNNTQGYALAQ